MKKLHTMRPAFSMITAIFVIMVMASIGAFVMDLTGKMVQETTTQYRKEQAILYAKSYTEYAIMAATARNCIQKITADVGGDADDVKHGQGYRVEVRVRYLGANSTCPNQFGTLNIPAPDSVILIDTFVRYRNPESPQAINGEEWDATNPGITYHRRTLQLL